MNPIEDIKRRLQETEEQIVWLKAERERLTFLLRRLEGNNSSELVYSPKWSWTKKIIYILRRENRPLTSAAIVDFLSEFEQFDDLSRRSAYQTIASILNTKSTEGLFRRLKKDGEKVRFELADF